MTPVVVIAAVGIGSYLLRISMLVLAARGGLPPLIERAARTAVPVSFAALAKVAVAQPARGAGLQPAPVLSVVAAAIVVRVTGRRYAALLAGLPVLWLLSALA
jgi:branched chain amino acid efflux pump